MTRGQAVVAVGVSSRKLVEVEHGEILYTAGAGRFEDADLAEIFLNTRKFGMAVDVNARDAGAAASSLLQHGYHVDIFRKALTCDSDGSASGPRRARWIF